MSYKICYDGPIYHIPQSGSSIVIKKLACIGLILAAAVCVHYLWPESTAVVWKLLLPGSDSTTVETINLFVENVRNGEPVGDSIMAFCQQIIHNAT